MANSAEGIAEADKRLRSLLEERGQDNDLVPVVYTQGDEELRQAILAYQHAVNANARALGLPENEIIDPEASFGDEIA